MTKESVIQLIRQYGPPRLIPQLEHCIKESLLLNTQPCAEDQIPIGTSKIGGQPDLPMYTEWPVWRGKPLAFVAQINLADLPQYDFLSILPDKGILSFFYDAEQEAWGFEPEDREGWRVLYFEHPELQRRALPSDLPDEGKYKSCSIGFSRSITIPSFESSYIALKYGELKHKEVDQYIELYEQLQKFLNEGDCIHRILGHPDQIQNDIQLECQLTSHGLNCGSSAGYADPRAETLKAGALDWVLLLQIDSDAHADMMWGDVGMLYYCIPIEELQKRNFEAVWMVSQCC